MKTTIRAGRLAGMRMLLGALVLVLAGCSTMKLDPAPNIPQPVITPLPVAIGLFVPMEFSQYVYRDERYGFKWEVSLGAAQSEALSRLLRAMFQRVVPVDNIQAAAQADPAVRAVLEPMVEEFSFVTPRDAGTPFYAVSIKYRVSVYTPDGRLAESWPFTGYGIVPSGGMSTQRPLARAAALAMRDAGAKLVVEFRDQAIVRGLLPADDRANRAPEEPAAPVVGTPVAEPQVTTEPSEASPPATEETEDVPQETGVGVGDTPAAEPAPDPTP